MTPGRAARRLRDAVVLNVAASLLFHAVTNVCRYLAADRQRRPIDVEALL